MSTNYQAAREALGARLRELRTEAGLSGRQMAARLNWPPSKVSKLETGRQTATPADLTGWARDLDRLDAETELHARLRALETHYSSWRRQLSAGTRAKQDAIGVDETRCTDLRNFEPACVPGLLQTPAYARSILTQVTSLHHVPDDLEAGVNARMRRQQVLYEPGHQLRFLLWEPVLHMLICPPDVMATQLDRLAGTIGLSAVELGIVPLNAALRQPPLHPFVMYDDKIVRVETLGAELRITDSTEVADYHEVWRRLEKSAVHGHEAHRLITRARSRLDLPR